MPLSLDKVPLVPSPLRVRYVCASTFLLFHPRLLCIFPAPVLEPAIFARSPGSFYWREVLETLSVLPDPSSCSLTCVSCDFCDWESMLPKSELAVLTGGLAWGYMRPSSTGGACGPCAPALSTHPWRGGGHHGQACTTQGLSPVI